MRKIPSDTLFKLTKVVFEQYHPKNETNNVEDDMKLQQRDGLDKILQFFNIEERMEKGYLIYSPCVDSFYKIPIKMVNKLKLNPYSYTYFHLSDFDLNCLEDLLNQFDAVASTYYPIFDVLGYTLTNIDGRWRLKEAYVEDSPLDFLKEDLS